MEPAFKKVAVKYHDYQLLKTPHRRQKLVKTVGDGSIITRFDKTPPPQKPTDVVCPHFLELKWANGCPFDCAWCYLKGTFRFLPTKTHPRLKDRDKIESHLLNFFDATVSNGNGYPREVLNTGELADSLMDENNGSPFSKFIISLFENQGKEKHRVLFLTKTVNIKNLLKIPSNYCPIVSFTLNAEHVSERWEHDAPSTRLRIKAARKLSEVGHRVRLRIDPMVPVEDWKEHYISLIDRIFSNLAPERITIGSLRGLQSTINNATDRSWVPYISERSNWGRKIDFQARHEMYSTTINHLKENHGFKRVSMCKETTEMWDSLGMDYREIKCNCIG